MSRVIEGTTLGGYRCDSEGCDDVAVFAPCIAVPYEGHPEEVKSPIMCQVDVHVCMKHWGALRIDKLLSKDKTDSIDKCASDNGGRPAYGRAYLRKIICHSAEFLSFQQRAKLVPPDDALVKDAIEGI